MRDALGWAITVVLWGWGVAEVVLQARQFMRRGVTERTERGSLVVLTVLCGGGLALAGVIAGRTSVLSYSTHPAAVRAAVLVVALAGIAVRLWAIVSLGRFFRGTVHIQSDHQVVRSGPYHWVRHPAYSGALLAGLAFEAMLGNLFAWVLAAVCCLLGCGYRIRVEERMLSESLGEAYTAYAADTRRLIPGVW